MMVFYMKLNSCTRYNNASVFEKFKSKRKRNKHQANKNTTNLYIYVVEICKQTLRNLLKKNTT